MKLLIKLNTGLFKLKPMKTHVIPKILRRWKKFIDQGYFVLFCYILFLRGSGVSASLWLLLKFDPHEILNTTPAMFETVIEIETLNTETKPFWCPWWTPDTKGLKRIYIKPHMTEIILELLKFQALSF